MKTIGVILGSGTGKRFGASFPKQFMSLNGKMVIQHSIDAMKESGQFDKIYCTLPHHEVLPNSSINLKNVDELILGGATRTETILNVLKACPKDTEYIVFHDSVRPFIKSEQFSKGLKVMKKYDLDYMITSQDITDALISSKLGEIKGENRFDYKLCQTPEFFKFKSLKERELDLLKNGNKYNYIGQTFTDTLMYNGSDLPYHDNNLKITYEHDLFNAEQMMKYAEIDETNQVKIKGKKILLFGGSGDIGKALINELKEKGAKIYAPSHNEFDLKKFHLYKTWDIFHKKFDCVIHTCGAYDTDDNSLILTYDKIMDVNLKSVVNIVYMAENYWLNPGGNIIILGSTCAGFGRKGISLYSASKAAINSFVEAYQHKLLEKNIKINVIAPAKVQGRLQNTINPNANQNEMIKPERLAEIISHYVDTDKTGQIVYVRYGLEDKVNG